MRNYVDKKNIVKIGDTHGKLEFLTGREVRQECSLYLTLFNTYVMHLRYEIRDEHTGGTIIGKVNFLTIICINDVILLAKTSQNWRK